MKKTTVDRLKDDFTTILGQKKMQKFEHIKGQKFYQEFKDMSIQLGKKWQDSDYEDLSYYHKDIYLFECCWSYLVSSQRAIQNLIKYFKDNIEFSKHFNVIDVYAGVGLTTRDLLTYFGYVDNINICDNQIKATYRFLEVNNSLMSFNFNDISDVKRLGNKYDIVVCLDSIEHFKNPMPLTKDLVNMVNDDGFLVETTAFCSPHWYGHYPEYLINNEIVSGRKASRAVHGYIRDYFDQVYSGWNGIPRIWHKVK